MDKILAFSMDIVAAAMQVANLMQILSSFVMMTAVAASMLVRLESAAILKGIMVLILAAP